MVYVESLPRGFMGGILKRDVWVLVTVSLLGFTFFFLLERWFAIHHNNVSDNDYFLRPHATTPYLGVRSNTPDKLRLTSCLCPIRVRSLDTPFAHAGH